jgi:hypothetical protein
MPHLLPLTGSDRNATITSIYMLQMSSVCYQTNTQVFLTLPVKSLLSCFTLRHKDTYVTFPYFFFVGKATKIHFLCWKEMTDSRKAAWFLLDNGLPVHWSLHNFHHQKYHKHHHIIYFRTRFKILFPLYLFFFFSVSLQKFSFSFLRLKYFVWLKWLNFIPLRASC